jgi:serine/threonine-protein kinase RsbT
MTVAKADSASVRTESDIVNVRQLTRLWCNECKFSLVDQTKMVTAASELARNAVIYGGGGTLRLEILIEGARKGLRLTFVDQGPGISDVERALSDGYSSGSGLGLGLGGARRLVNDFEIKSAPGQGTTVMITRWK